MSRVLRLGTRASLLALAQSRGLAAALGERVPGIRVELIPVSTPGDRDTQTPLQAVTDPDFFSSDLDDALLGGQVDCCVHSLKDLPARRPAGIRRAALPVRENPRDVILWRPEVISLVQAGEPLRLGTCSERRQRNVADFLRIGLPAGSRPPRLSFHDLRGAVDLRLRRLALPRNDAAALDGVVLALAGLARLWSDPDGRAAIAPLLDRLRWMVLPLGRCPAAPGQGVLAVECRADDAATQDLLRTLHDPDTAALLALEETAIATVPATDRAAFGATAVNHASLGPLCYLRGRTETGEEERLLWSAPASPSSAGASTAGSATGFDGIAWQRACTRQMHPPLAEVAALPPGSAVFAAYWHAIEQQPLPADTRLWVSGVESWRRLAARGLWVEGCGDNLGFSTLTDTLGCPVLGLPPLTDWTALTYRWAVPGWQASGVGRVLATYDILPPEDPAIVADLEDQVRRASHFYWSSAEQYHALRAAVPAGAHHASGAGKTLRALRAAGLNPQPFPNGREWHRWLQ